MVIPFIKTLCIRLGFTCSEDTLERFWSMLHKHRNESGALAQLNPEAFTVISVNNIDVLSPYAAVTTDPSRSWHGTSIMAQQPKPDSRLQHSSEKLSYDSNSENSRQECGNNLYIVIKSSQLCFGRSVFLSFF